MWRSVGPLARAVPKARAASRLCYAAVAHPQRTANALLHHPHHHHLTATTSTIAARSFHAAVRAQALQPEPDKSYDAVLAITETTLNNMQNERMMYIKALRGIATDMANESLMKRWQQLMEIYFTSLLHAIIPYGYQSNEQGLKVFNEVFEITMRSHPSKARLLDLTKQRWRVMVKAAFNVELREEDYMTLDRARKLSERMAAGLQKEDFLQKVTSAVASLPKNAQEMDKHKAVMDLLLPQQMKAIEEFGFKGDDGYVRMQTAMIDHANDETIMYNVMSSTMAVFRRAGLSMPTA